VVLDNEQNAGSCAKSQERLIYRHGIHVITAVDDETPAEPHRRGSGCR
jgi:hypothetical protein